MRDKFFLYETENCSSVYDATKRTNCPTEIIDFLFKKLGNCAIIDYDFVCTDGRNIRSFADEEHMEDISE